MFSYKFDFIVHYLISKEHKTNYNLGGIIKILILLENSKIKDLQIGIKNPSTMK